MLSKLALGILGVGLVIILSLGYVGYNALNPHAMTVTGQQYVTNTQMGTTTVTTVSTVNNQAVQTITAAATVSNSGNTVANGLNCGSGSNSYGCNWPYTYDACQGTGQGNDVACDGYLMQGSNGCVVLAVPTDTVQQPAYDHYALQNLPSSYPSMGSWVVVKGSISLAPGPNTAASNPSACPTSSISVTSIQPANPPPAP